MMGLNEGNKNTNTTIYSNPNKSNLLLPGIHIENSCYTPRRSKSHGSLPVGFVPHPPLMNRDAKQEHQQLQRQQKMQRQQAEEQLPEDQQMQQQQRVQERQLSHEQQPQQQRHVYQEQQMQNQQISHELQPQQTEQPHELEQQEQQPKESEEEPDDQVLRVQSLERLRDMMRPALLYLFQSQSEDDLESIVTSETDCEGSYRILIKDASTQTSTTCRCDDNGERYVALSSENSLNPSRSVSPSVSATPSRRHSISGRPNGPAWITFARRKSSVGPVVSDHYVASENDHKGEKKEQDPEDEDNIPQWMKRARKLTQAEEEPKEEGTDDSHQSEWAERAKQSEPEASNEEEKEKNTQSDTKPEPSWVRKMKMQSVNSIGSLIGPKIQIDQVDQEVKSEEERDANVEDVHNSSRRGSVVEQLVESIHPQLSKTTKAQNSKKSGKVSEKEKTEYDRGNTLHDRVRGVIGKIEKKRQRRLSATLYQDLVIAYNQLNVGLQELRCEIQNNIGNNNCNNNNISNINNLNISNNDDKNDNNNTDNSQMTGKQSNRRSVCQIGMLAYNIKRQKEIEEEKRSNKEKESTIAEEGGGEGGGGGGVNIGNLAHLKNALPQLGNVILVPQSSEAGSSWDFMGLPKGMVTLPRRNSDIGPASRTNQQAAYPKWIRGATQVLNASKSYPGVSMPDTPAPRIHYGGGKIWKPPGELRQRKPPIAHAGDPGYNQH